jgi:hypothetical protein
MKLLTIGNQKTLKGESVGYLTGVLHLAPFTLSGVNVCPMAELAGCVRACLNTAGRGGIAKGGMVTVDTLRDGTRTNAVQECRIRRTRWYLTERDAFMAELARDVARLVRKATRAGMVAVVRLNGTSDIRWEDVPVGSHANIFAAFPDVQFYDYTKIPNRRRALDVPNYHLTFSYSARPEFAGIVAKALECYGSRVNYAAVFKRALPAQFLGRAVVSGDNTDLRFLDAPGVVVGLTAKGNAKRDTSGFVVA